MPDFSIRVSGAQPQIVRLTQQIPGLPEGLKDKRILFVTDIHCARTFPERALSRLIDTICAQAPDLLLLGGDYAETESRERAFSTAIARVRPPLGAFAVPGNNDYESMRGDYTRLNEWLRDAGVCFLLNERKEIPVAGGRLVITGIDETKHGAPDPRAFQPPKPGDCSILLTHSPWALDEIFPPGAKTAHLALCGHTHGGQITIGGFTPYRVGFERARHGEPNKRRYFFTTGAHEVSGMTVLVSNGVGTSLLPIRIGAMPQMHVITLQ